MTVSEVYKIIKEIKSQLPDMPIILGGQHPSGAPHDVLGRPYVDYIISGEAELTILKFMDALTKKYLLKKSQIYILKTKIKKL